MITSFATLLQQIKADFDAAFVVSIPLPTAYPNATFTPPATGLYARLSVVMGEGEQTQFGSTKRFRDVGNLFVQIYAPIGTGEGAAAAAAESIAARYRAVSRVNATFLTPSIQPGGRDPVEPRWITTVRCPFYADREV